QPTPPSLHSPPFPTRRSSDLGIFHIRDGWDLFCTEESNGQSIELHSHILQNIDYRSSDVNPSRTMPRREAERGARRLVRRRALRSEEHTSELQSRFDLVCRLL